MMMFKHKRNEIHNKNIWGSDYTVDKLINWKRIYPQGEYTVEIYGIGRSRVVMDSIRESIVEYENKHGIIYENTVDYDDFT